MKKFLKEPLVHFLLIGGSIFGLYFMVSDIQTNATDRVDVNVGVVKRLSSQFTRRWLRPPTNEELRSLINEHVKEEILYREAIKLGLEQDDAVVRRRLRQKMEFISTDLLQMPDPEDEQLQKFLNENPGMFKEQVSLAFQHVFFSTQKRGFDAEPDAEKAKEQLNSTNVNYLLMGDPTLLPAEIPLASISSIRNQFGESFAVDIKKLDPNEWHGPIASSYGYHLVKIIDRVEPLLPELDRIRAEVLREWKFKKEQALQGQFYDELMKKYTITIQWPDSVATSGATPPDS